MLTDRPPSLTVNEVRLSLDSSMNGNLDRSTEQGDVSRNPREPSEPAAQEERTSFRSFLQMIDGGRSNREPSGDWIGRTRSCKNRFRAITGHCKQQYWICCERLLRPHYSSEALWTVTIQK